jgi:Rieske Fe-S protein
VAYFSSYFAGYFDALTGSIAEGVGLSEGTSTAEAVGTWIVEAVGESAGTGTAEATAESTVEAVAEAAGAAESLGIADVPVAEPYSETPAGRKKRRKYVIEIDGQVFVTESIAEAQAVLAQAQTLAVKHVETVVKSARHLGPAKPKIAAPPELASEVKAIEKVYSDAYRDAEIQALLALQAEQDDEEALLLLI